MGIPLESMGRRAAFLFCGSFVLAIAGCSGPSPQLHRTNTVVRLTDGDDSPLKLVGERIFRETRFAQYFYMNSNGVVNKPPLLGDPVVENLITIAALIPNPYRGQAISCAACHLVDQVMHLPGAGNRGYTDFARRSPIPDRGDGHSQTPRNAPTMVGSTISSSNFLHHDGEFATPEDLVIASYTGRNLGWLPGESQIAIKHMVNVIRSDDGSFPTETDLGGLSYRRLFAGDPSLPSRFIIPPQYRLDITAADDATVFKALINLVVGYMASLDFKRDASGNYNGSPYDVFLRKNGLPLAPAAGETPKDYTARLATLVSRLKNPAFVTEADGHFKLSNQTFVFGASELQGLKTFVGNGRCTQCHSAPDFTDHLFHNTGASQDEYESLHGTGSFWALQIPNLKTRNANSDLYLPASDSHPKAQSIFRAQPAADHSELADLGAWNVFGNPDMPHPQVRMRTAICDSLELDCEKLTDDDLLDRAVAMVKTPTLRDLGQSDPYLHTGQMNLIEDVMKFYIRSPALARAGKIRNADPHLKDIQITEADIQTLANFLRSLNEDYD